jgi:hypothetical protein
VKLVEVCSKLSILELYGYHKLTDFSISLLANKCPDLIYLELGFCNITDESLFAIVFNCSKLQYLGLKGTSVSDCTVEHLPQGCPNLSFINLDRCAKVTIEMVKGVLLKAFEYQIIVVFNGYHWHDVYGKKINYEHTIIVDSDGNYHHNEERFY